jgi:hypothetical protein
VRRRTDGQELGQPFHDAEQDGEQIVVQYASSENGPASSDLTLSNCGPPDKTTPLKPTEGFHPSEPSLAGDPGLNGPPDQLRADVGHQ